MIYILEVFLNTLFNELLLQFNFNTVGEQKKQYSQIQNFLGELMK